ncbi:uncharacterized protein LOC135822989 isoform X1 [Sycon ciliatum]|uniref:uncharacterized protein LOC135822989 isoform X1 n=1 Tax=Sycon ciliatum TaxID=27933 RepID=UPI0031F62603
MVAPLTVPIENPCMSFVVMRKSSGCRSPHRNQHYVAVLFSSKVGHSKGDDSVSRHYPEGGCWPSPDGKMSSFSWRGQDCTDPTIHSTSPERDLTTSQDGSAEIYQRF